MSKVSRCKIPNSFEWEPNTYYKASVSWREGNPFHTVIIYSGFLNNGWPSGYNKVWSGCYEEAVEFANNPKFVINDILKLFTKE